MTNLTYWENLEDREWVKKGYSKHFQCKLQDLLPVLDQYVHHEFQLELKIEYLPIVQRVLPHELTLV